MIIFSGPLPSVQSLYCPISAKHTHAHAHTHTQTHTYACSTKGNKARAKKEAFPFHPDICEPRDLSPISSRDTHTMTAVRPALPCPPSRRSSAGTVPRYVAGPPFPSVIRPACSRRHSRRRAGRNGSIIPVLQCQAHFPFLYPCLVSPPPFLSLSPLLPPFLLPPSGAMRVTPALAALVLALVSGGSAGRGTARATSEETKEGREDVGLANDEAPSLCFLLLPLLSLSSLSPLSPFFRRCAPDALLPSPLCSEADRCERETRESGRRAKGWGAVGFASPLFFSCASFPLSSPLPRRSVADRRPPFESARCRDGRWPPF